MSAARYKNNIETLQVEDTGLNMLMRLRPVSYYYNNDVTGTKYWGLIADEAASTSPQLAYFNPDGSVQTLNTFGFLALLTKSTQEINLNLETIASTTSSSTPESRSFATSFFNRVGEWLGEATNNIKKLYAERVETKELCVADDSGDKTCITKNQLDDLLQNAGNNSGGSSNTPPTPTPVPDPTPDPIPDPIPDPTPDPIPDPIPDLIPDPTLVP